MSFECGLRYPSVYCPPQLRIYKVVRANEKTFVSFELRERIWRQKTPQRKLVVLRGRTVIVPGASMAESVTARASKMNLETE